jgi:hypothetical protein
MKLIVKSPVWVDLREIGLWIAEENPEAAERFFKAAEKAFELLRLHPMNWPPSQFFCCRSALLGDSRISKLHCFLSTHKD